MKKVDNQALVIFGASGDLTYRKLIPSVFDLYINNSLPEGYAILGVSRTDFSDQEFRNKMKEGIMNFSNLKDIESEKIESFLAKLFYVSIDTKKSDDYALVKARLKELNTKFNLNNNYIFYLSTPPELYSVIPKYLYGQGLTLQHKGFRRVL